MLIISRKRRRLVFVYGEMEKCLNPHVHGKKKKMPLYPSGEKHLDLDNTFPENDGFQGEPL